ncbi:asparagine synthase (glutamine-hydrolyzing) [Qipengyuania gaetbuli]|uniref:asparagine synthase (glutamine-hydrolyzing) n=1 Tax=Qipengyuania gaetbuli TaxID=266952 RepID=UPI001C99DA1F|nr:asparagine synthase (glutamine-hydrolyzing) [Qipengyuania gaetbuli]MBY6016079.1 asparagine synthase (glutamine-hydrolyzing) [Qipengyuania gaetbuli]
MCGITGLYGGPSFAANDAGVIVERMTASLTHRGPDAGGTWIDSDVALGHRRLSILDLSESGSQPMISDCGRYVIAFNGEIYDHLRIRSNLEDIGAAPAWRGHSDTETLLAGISHWGVTEALKRANGMFAFALWDRAEKRLFLARDRIGEKPLYWGWAGSSLIFGSELKALKAHPECPTAICRDALAQYLTYAYVPAPRSIHPGIYKLEPGCILEVEGPVPSEPPECPLRPGNRYGTISVKRYWSLNETLEAGYQFEVVSEAEALHLVESSLSDAIARQMISDVPLGAFLSGGIDSSLIVSLMQAQTSRPVKTFTVGFESESFDEAPFAAAVANHLATDHTEIRVTEREAQEVIPKLPYFYDEPFGDSSQIPTHLVCRTAREHVTVALSGDAGDELFGGYNRYVVGPDNWRRLEKLPKPIRRAVGQVISATPVSIWEWIGSGAFGKFSVRYPGEKAEKIGRALREVDNIDDLYRSLIAAWSPRELLSDNPYPSKAIADDPLPKHLASDPAARMMAQDMRSYLPDDILCKVDRAAMGVSLETRVPFLDPAVILAAARLPTSIKIRNGQGKWPLRQILNRYVPRELIERPKTGFSLPIGEWLRGPLRSWAEDLLTPEALERDGLIDPEPIQAAWKEHLSGRSDWSHKLWIILMFQAWRARWT